MFALPGSTPGTAIRAARERLTAVFPSDVPRGEGRLLFSGGRKGATHSWDACRSRRNQTTAASAWAAGRGHGSLDGVPTLVLDPQPVELTALIDRRRRLGQDLFDEVWKGVLHMNPAPAGWHARVDQQLAELLGALARRAGLTATGPFNLGQGEKDYRVPDRGLHRDWSDRVWYSTAALVVEIVSPGDESYQKLEFYATRRVDEVVIIDREKRMVQWLHLSGEEYEPVERSRLIELGRAELEQQIDWPYRSRRRLSS
jgi:Uma2 family endonuclease